MVSLLSMILEGLKDIWNWTTTKPPTEISSPPPLDAPHPYGTAAQLNRFLIQYYTNLLGLSYDEASRLADELPIRGFILYGMPESVLEDIYGSLGRILYYELQHSLHGRYSTIWAYLGPFGYCPTGVIPVLAIFLGALLDLWHHWMPMPCLLSTQIGYFAFAGLAIDGLLAVLYFYLLYKSVRIGPPHDVGWPSWIRVRPWGWPKFDMCHCKLLMALGTGMAIFSGCSLLYHIAQWIK